MPEITAACGTDWRITDHLSFNPGFRYMYHQPMFKNGDFQSDLKHVAGDSVATAEINGRKNRYFTHVNNFFLDFGISYTDLYFEGLDLGVAVKNVTNNQTEQSQSFNTGTNVWRGTTFDATLRWSF